jgi:hypothetical protein
MTCWQGSRRSSREMPERQKPVSLRRQECRRCRHECPRHSDLEDVSVSGYHSVEDRADYAAQEES